MTDDVELRASINFETDQAKASAAQKAVQGIKDSANGAAEAVNKVKPDGSAEKGFGKAKESAEKAFSAIDSARQVTEGGLMGLGQTIRNLAGQFPALMAAIAPVGLALAAFSAWKRAIDSVSASIASVKAGLRAIAADNFEAQVKREAEAWQSLYSAIHRASEERQMYSNIEQAKDDAALRGELAKLELEKQQRYAGLAEGDELGRRKIDLDIASRRSDLEEASASRKSSREAGDLAAEESKQRQIIAAKKLEEEAIQAQVMKRMGVISGMVNQGVKDSSGFTSMPTREKIWAAIASETEKLQVKNETSFAQLKAVQEEQHKAKQAIIAIQAARGINATDRENQNVQSQTRKTADYNTGTGIDRDQNAQIDALFQDLNAASADGSAVFRNWARQQIEAKERENALTAEFMQQMIGLAEANAKQIQDGTARARRL